MSTVKENSDSESSVLISVTNQALSASSPNRSVLGSLTQGPRATCVVTASHSPSSTS